VSANLNKLNSSEVKKRIASTIAAALALSVISLSFGASANADGNNQNQQQASQSSSTETPTSSTSTSSSTDSNTSTSSDTKTSTSQNSGTSNGQGTGQGLTPNNGSGSASGASSDETPTPSTASGTDSGTDTSTGGEILLTQSETTTAAETKTAVETSAQVSGQSLTTPDQVLKVTCTDNPCQPVVGKTLTVQILSSYDNYPYLYIDSSTQSGGFLGYAYYRSGGISNGLPSDLPLIQNYPVNTLIPSRKTFAESSTVIPPGVADISCQAAQGTIYARGSGDFAQSGSNITNNSGQGPTTGNGRELPINTNGIQQNGGNGLDLVWNNTDTGVATSLPSGYLTSSYTFTSADIGSYIIYRYIEKDASAAAASRGFKGKS
jgi:hypothetical protein